MDATVGAAAQLFDEGHHDDGIFLLQAVANIQSRKFGPNNARTLRTRSTIAALLVEGQKYAEALKIFLDVYKRKLKVLGISHPCTLDTRSCIQDVLEEFGSVEVTSVIMKDAESVFRRLKKMIRKKYRKGLYAESMREGLDILEDMLVFLGDNSLITLQMGALIAIIYAETEEYDYALEILEDVYLKANQIFRRDQKIIATILSKKAHVLHKMCDFEAALNAYTEAYDMRKIALGRIHRLTLISMRRVAEVTRDVGNYDEALTILNHVAYIQAFHNYKEAIIARIDEGNLEFSRGRFEEALSIFKQISKAKASKRTKAMIRNKRGLLLVKLGLCTKGRLVLRDALKIIKSTRFNADTLSTYRNIAIALQGEGKIAQAHALLCMLVDACDRNLNAGHSVSLSIENDLGELYFSRNMFNEALRVFTKLWNFESLTLGRYHPATLHAKCQVARVFTKQGRYDDALRMYNEVLPIMKARYYPQQRDRLMVEVDVASLYLKRSSYVKAFDMYYTIYEVIAKSYGSDHQYTTEILERMQSFTDLVPLRRLIQATLMNNIDDIKTFVEEGDDVNARDVNGAVTLHYAAREGYVDILKYLMSKGAIYEITDMFGNTPESFATDGSTKFVFLLVKRLFECAMTNELEQVKRIIQRDPLIMNVRDAGSRTPLQWAAAKGNIEVVRELVAQGADVSLGSEEDGTVLHIAAGRGHSDIMNIILSYTYCNSPELFRVLLDDNNNFVRSTALHVSAENNHRGCVNLLINYGANPLVKDIFEKFSYDMGKQELRQELMTYAFSCLKDDDSET